LPVIAEDFSSPRSAPPGAGVSARAVTLLLSVVGASAEFERALIRERQHEAIALAKQPGVYRGRRKALTAKQADQLASRAATGEPKAALAREFNISRETTLLCL